MAAHEEIMATFIKFVSHKLSTEDNVPAPNQIQVIKDDLDGIRVLAEFRNWYQVTRWLDVFIRAGFSVIDCRGVHPYHSSTEVTLGGPWSHPVVIYCPALAAIPQEVLDMRSR